MSNVIFILGTGHCGSTLLDLILGSHSKMFSLGEVYRVVSSNPPAPICDICEGECSFWKPELLAALRKSYNPNIKDRICRKLCLQENQEVSFYRKLFRASGANLLVDSSKNPGWINRNGDSLQLSNIKPILIYLSRDGRAVVNSYYRKYPERGLERLANNWNSRIESINNCYDSWPNRSKIHIRYEDLAKKPEATIKKLMDYLQMSLENDIIQFWKHEHHLITGNAGTKSMLLKFRDEHRHEEWIGDNNKDYYKQKELGIELDERWKRELSIEQVEKLDYIIRENNISLI